MMIFKRIIATFVLIMAIVSFVPATASAADLNTKPGDFLGFPAWNRGLPKDMKGQSPAKLVWTVALNVIDMALRVAAIIAIGFIIYGGFRYLTSRGNPDKASAGQDTILKAVIGLVICILASVVVSFAVGRLAA
jgi:hypothetical protein